MAQTTKEYVFRLMKEKDLIFYTLKDTDGRSILDDQQDPDYTVQKSIDQLENSLSHLSGSYVFINLSQRSRKAKGAGGDTKTSTYDFKLKLDGVDSGTSQKDSGINAALIRQMEENAALRAELVDIKRSHEIDLLRREFQEYKENSKGSNPLLEQLTPHVIRIISGVGAGGAKQAVAIHGPGDGEDTEADQLKKIKIAITRLRKVDPSIGDHLLLLAEFAEKKTDMYLNFIPTIKSMV